MADELERRWDDAIEAAWVEFRQRVADRLAVMGEDETFLLEMPDDADLAGATPYCQVLAGPGWLRVEAVSNAYLDESVLLDDEQQGRLREIGFAEPTEEHSANFWVDVEQREADRAAWMVREALRQVYAVLHPAYLAGDPLGKVAPMDEGGPAAAPEADEATSFPQSPEELTVALVEVVGGILGKHAELDEDGDLAIQTDLAVLYVTVAQHAARALLFATLVTDVVDDQRALVEVNLLNKAEFGLTFIAAEGRITMRRELPLTAFVPSDVRTELTRILADLDRWVAELIARVGGRGWLEDGEVHQPQDRQSVPPTAARDNERFGQALRVLRELEGQERGSVDATTMLRIFHADRDLLLEASRWAASRASRWVERRHKADEEGKAGYAKVCRAQQRYYHELLGRVRQALRSAVQASVKRERQEQLELFAEDEASA